MTMTRRLALLAPATVALGAAAFSSTPARAAMKTEAIDYSHGNTKLKAHVAYDDSVTGKRPAIFMVHARNGLTDFAKHRRMNGRNSAITSSPPTCSACCRKISRRSWRRPRCSAKTARS